MFRGPPLCKRGLIFRIGSILSYRSFRAVKGAPLPCSGFPARGAPHKLFV